MRLISQNKLNDIPYEQACLYVDEGTDACKIEASTSFSENYIIMGVYRTLSEAQEVISKIHSYYYGGRKVFIFPYVGEVQNV